MKALIDGDILLHEIGWSTEFKDKDSGDPILLNFDRAQELLDEKIRLIQEDTETDDVLVYISDSQRLTDQINKERRWIGLPEKEFVPNFRYEVAKAKPYKGTRKNPKPFHFNNILSYIRGEYPTVISEGGLEADDEMAIEQTKSSGTIICSRDKDLRQVPGNHYSWECGKQGSIGPVQCDGIGWIERTDKGKILGYGDLFFYYQLLAGDSVDNIPGLPGCGSVGAYRELCEATTNSDAGGIVKRAYIDKLGSEAKEYFFEQASLLWLIRERGKHYEFPKE